MQEVSAFQSTSSGNALVVLSILCRWAKSKTRLMMRKRFENSGYKTVPKGKTAVYVGQKDGEFQRVLVPIAYLNHPLFEDLLKESENEYGFVYSGGVAIPCGISYFEGVLRTIKMGASEPWHKLPRVS